jgi:hypothetical protein
MNTGSLEDVAMDAQKILSQERILLSKIDKPKTISGWLFISQAGRIDPRGPPDPKGSKT